MTYCDPSLTLAKDTYVDVKDGRVEMSVWEIPTSGGVLVTLKWISGRTTQIATWIVGPQSASRAIDPGDSQ